MSFNLFVLNKERIILGLILIYSFVILIFSIARFINCKQNKNVDNNIQVNLSTNTVNDVDIKDLVEQFTNKINSNSIEVQEYSVIPQYIQNYLVVGELQISSINLDTYILNETSDKTLNISVTKLAGPKINEIGNFCITGHNYLKENMFGQLKKVNIGDKVTLIDTFGKIKEYEVYDKYEISPDDVSVLNQNTNGKIELTLITCTIGAKNRVVVKAVAK